VILKLAVSRSRPPVPYVANLFYYIIYKQQVDTTNQTTSFKIKNWQLFYTNLCLQMQQIKNFLSNFSSVARGALQFSQRYRGASLNISWTMGQLSRHASHLTIYPFNINIFTMHRYTEHVLFKINAKPAKLQTSQFVSAKTPHTGKQITQVRYTASVHHEVSWKRSSRVCYELSVVFSNFSIAGLSTSSTWFSHAPNSCSSFPTAIHSDPKNFNLIFFPITQSNWFECVVWQRILRKFYTRIHM